MWLNFPNPVAVADGEEVEAKKVKQTIYKALQQEIQPTVSEERWQGKLIENRWDDEKVKLEESFACLSSWKNAPTHAGSSALAQTMYVQRHNNAFKILFFEVLRSLDLITKVEPWFSQVTPKPLSV